MSPSRQPVKASRRYDSSARQEAARLRRETVLDTAQRLLLRDGYARTSVPVIAETAAVSAETVYKSYGGKAGLVRAIQQRALAGSGPVPAEQRSDDMSAHETNPVALLRQWTTLATEVAPRISPIMLLVRAAAATDAEMAALSEEMTRQQLTRMTHNARRLAALRGVRKDLAVARIRDVLAAYTTPELYQLLVLRQRWPVRDFGNFMFRGYVAELLDPVAT